MDVEDAAKLLGVSTRTIRRLVAKQAIGHHRIGQNRGLVRFTEQDIADYLESVRVRRYI